MQLTTKSKIHICSFAGVLFVHQDCFSLSFFEDIGHEDFCLLSNLMDLNGTTPSKENAHENLKAMSLSRNPDLVSQDNQQTVL